MLKNRTDADYAPVWAGWNEVQQWAGEHGIRCPSWNELPAVNRAREAADLPTFKRKFAMGERG